MSAQQKEKNLNKISRRESAALINSLNAGVVPRIGLRHVAVGRRSETAAFLQDLDTVENGGASFRIISGKYGSGKSFLIQMIRNNAMERKFLVADADLSPERRLSGTQRQGVATYRELMHNLSTSTKPDGGAASVVVQKFINGLYIEAKKEVKGSEEELVDVVSLKITETLHEMSELPHGHAFGVVLEAYWRGQKTGQEELKQSALRWLRGEFENKNDARRELNVDKIIDDYNWYEFLKLFALFSTKVGYKGLIVFIDECVNLYKISNRVSRENNYEKLLTIFNDTMQGKAQHIGVFLGGTPEFIEDSRRGLYSYEALQSRLQGNKFATNGLLDHSSPVVNLSVLSPEEIYLLLERLVELHCTHYTYIANINPEQLEKYLTSELSRVGASKLISPREITKNFIGLLNILYHNPDITFEQIITNTHSSNYSDGDKKTQQISSESPKNNTSTTHLKGTDKQNNDNNNNFQPNINIEEADEYSNFQI